MLEVLILTGLTCIYVHSCLYVHSISTCTKLDLYWTFWNVTTSSRGSACTHMYWQSFLLSALWLCFAASVLPSLSSLLYKYQWNSTFYCSPIFNLLCLLNYFVCFTNQKRAYMHVKGTGTFETRWHLEHVSNLIHNNCRPQDFAKFLK